VGIQIVTALAQARYATIMTDTCTIRRIVDTDTNFSDGRVTYTQTVVYSGVCRVQQVGPGGNMSGAPGADPGGGGQASNQIVSYVLQLPLAGTDDLTPDDEATIDTCAQDPTLVGHKLRIQGLTRASHKSSRRLQCIEVV